ncbi:hypothetical protein OB905_04025 [Halobacteria archaeon AArc-dxtr1]|nr:hypothetical protein [Halobacteria archaeon AArc-dxtr1]
MSDDSQSDSTPDVDGTLVFETRENADDRYERVAEGIRREGDWRAVTTYELDRGRTRPLLRVHVQYFPDDDREPQHTTRTYGVDDGVVESTGQELTAFVEDHFDTEQSVADEFENVLG